MNPSAAWSAPNGEAAIHFTAKISSFSGPETICFPDGDSLSLCSSALIFGDVQGFVDTISADEWEDF